MRIGIFGAGRMASSLGSAWTATGHELFIGARDLAKADKLAGELGARHGTFAEAAEFGEALLLAVPADAVARVLPDRLQGKVLIDCTVPMDFGTFVLTSPDGRSGAEHLAEHPAVATGAHVVKAFNVCHENVYRKPVFDGTPLLVPVCGDDAAAVALVRTLVTDIGGEPVDGGLVHARLTEALAGFAVRYWFAGVDARAALPRLEHAFGEE